LRPLLFVAMPFGVKRDHTGTHDINFDTVYERAIKPAAAALNLEVIRADEERTGGIIHVSMFERLLLAEIVVADVTIPNPNVFYELGVRHSARPRTTILIRGKEGQLPFDVFLIRALSYSLEDGELKGRAADELTGQLIDRLKAALEDLESKDSPLFQLISRYPGIDLPHDVTESFRDRARYIDRMRERFELARKRQPREAAIAEIRGIEKELGPFNETHSELLVDLLLSYRDVKGWDEMISVVARLPRPLRNALTIREQYAFALNRRNARGDRERAIAELNECIHQHGISPETCGIYGRIYKDASDEAAAAGRSQEAEAHLDEAIAWYSRGFEQDPRDYYPGINAATLLYKKGTKDALAALQTILPAVSFAVARRGGINSRDYWDIATVLEVAVLTEDWHIAHRAVGRLLVHHGPLWTIETTVRNLETLKGVRGARGLPTRDVEDIIRTLEEKARSL